ncbi:hypothetical protein [Paenibacillus sp. N3.4]|uniref:hypothetical protein n=1 Tax=Paenibacillus sp. N3.4 TaxID=2603222 RepID=UPI0011C84C5C|nr:hypothetical protein [Paenibacillus sp. N3.4]TXK76082.1 hypothetical protein FU659_26145 [Paenibacillus sp. N3.4]
MTSKKEGDTLKKWVDREVKRFTERYVPEYQKVESPKELTIDGNPAIEVRTGNTYDQTNWDASDSNHLIKGDYKYEIAFQFDKKDDLSETFLQSILNSVQITKPSSSLGTIKDSYDDYDRSKMRSVKNKNYGYTLQVPEEWKADTRKSTKDFQAFTYMTGAFFVVGTDIKDLTPQETIQKFKDGIGTKVKASDIKETENRTETINGVTAVWVVWEYKDVVTTTISFIKNGTTYMISDSHSKATNTAFMKKQISDTMKSFQSSN